jgi:hypothetical protein
LSCRDFNVLKRDLGIANLRLAILLQHIQHQLYCFLQIGAQLLQGITAGMRAG